MDYTYLKQATKTPSADGTAVRETVQSILNDIRVGGEEAVAAYAAKFDQWDGLSLIHISEPTRP